MFVVQFVTILSIIHHHLVAMMRQEGMMSLLEYAQFCTVFVGNDESHESHAPAKMW